MPPKKHNRAPIVDGKGATIQTALPMFSLRDQNDWSYDINHRLHIKRRTCTTFIRKEPPKNSNGFDEDLEKVRCGCNRRFREHSWDKSMGTDEKWDRNRHTIDACNNAFGFTPDSHAHYIRCDIKTEPSVLKDLMFNVWGMKKPRLIMCIIGGAKYFKLNERLEREFIKGIIQAALKADGWIVTSGFKTGVVQLVGEAIHDHKVTNPKSSITAIGCSKWGSVRNRQNLLNTKPKIDLAETMSEDKSIRGQQDLEPNHTHFILLDDGTFFDYESGDYRTRFVTEIAKQEQEQLAANQLPNIRKTTTTSLPSPRDKFLQIPTVTIVVEGGPDTLSTICKDLRQDIPVVLIDGSGRAPNLLAKFLNRTESLIVRIEKSSDSNDFKKLLDTNDPDDLEKLEKAFEATLSEMRDGLREISKGSKTSDKELKDLLKSFLFCLQPVFRSKIHIYSLDSEYDLDDTIFEAIIQAKQSEDKNAKSADHRLQLLNLAIDWDALDVAKEHIIKDDLSEIRGSKKKELFLRALALNRPGFVNTFIKMNFDVAKMFYRKNYSQHWDLNWEELKNLYNKDEKIKRQRLYLFDDCLKKQTLERPKELDEVLQNLIGDYMRTIYHSTPSGLIENFTNNCCCCCSSTSRVSDSHPDDERIQTRPIDEQRIALLNDDEILREIQEKVYRDLFFWAVLTNRIEMSKVFLCHLRSRICAALMGSRICKSYVKYAVDNESKEFFLTEANQFENYACEALKCCYNYDEEKACEIAIRRIDVLGSVTCLQVAVDAEDKAFVGQPCCDQLLTNVWSGKMVPYQVSWIKRCWLLLGLVTFGFSAPFLVDFRDEDDSDDSTEKNRKKTKDRMTVNEDEDDERLEKPSTTQRLNDRGIDYSNSRQWKMKCCSKPISNYFQLFKHFHGSPIVKFSYNCISYIFFLLLFSYFLLFDFNPPTDSIPSIHWTEILVIIIVSTMLIEDIRQFFSQENRTIGGKLKNYFVKNLFFSAIRSTSYILFYIGLILRFTNASTTEDLVAAKIVLAYDLELWFIRSLAFLSIAQKMGPKLVMIRKMIIDLFFFTYIIVIAMTAYGVASRSMHNYNADNDTNDLTFDGQSVFRHIIYPSYYLMYGSTDNELQALDNDQSAGGAMATQVLLAFHMLFVNILLINLLIAMFSYTFESVQSQTDLVWRYERYSLIREYFDRPPFFPPLIIFTHLYELIRLLIRFCQARRRNEMNFIEGKSFKMIAMDPKTDQDWSEFESYATNRYARTVVNSLSSPSTALVSTKTRQEIQQTTIDANMVPTGSSTIEMKSITDELISMRKIIVDLRNHADEMNRCMQWMMDAMERVKMSKEPKPRLKPAITTNDRIDFSS